MPFQDQRCCSSIGKYYQEGDHLQEVPVESYFECDTFEEFDVNIVRHFASLLVSNMAPFPRGYQEIIKKRKTRKHFSAKFAHHYEAPLQADRLIAEIKEFSLDSAQDTGEIITLYTTKCANIDKHYRDFYIAFDRIALKEDLYALRDLVENIYTNGYLLKLAMMWADKLEKISSLEQLPGRKQHRFALSSEPLPSESTLSFSLDYLGKDNKDFWVTIPRGVEVFKVPGGGQNYVHGGASLQEIIVPLLKVKTERYKKEVGYVEVALISLTRKVTNLITYLDFMQTKNVSDVLRPVQVKAYFETESGKRISNEKIIIADKKNADPENRQFRGKFTFRNRRYSKEEKHYLIMKDAPSDLEINRHEFIIDIAFAGDFGFTL